MLTSTKCSGNPTCAATAPEEIDEIRANAELVYAAREHMERTFRSAELDPRRRH
jgi:hypothetical protein